MSFLPCSSLINSFCCGKTFKELKDLSILVDYGVVEWCYLAKLSYSGTFFSSLMVISFLQRRCHPVTWCIQKIADQPCYSSYSYLTQHAWCYWFRLSITQHIHTYIHNWPLQHFSQDYWPSFSHHLCCVC